MASFYVWRDGTARRSTSGGFSAAPLGRICATTPEHLSNRVTWRHVTVHVINKRVKVDEEKQVSRSCRHLMMSTWSVSKNKSGNAAEHVLYLEGMMCCINLYVSFSFIANSSHVFLPLYLNCFLRLLVLQLMKGKDHVETHFKHQINHSFTAAWH